VDESHERIFHRLAPRTIFSANLASWYYVP
jgi:hypothetical protein